jgi:hypothetical protein
MSAGLLFLVAGTSGAEQYLVNASAGNSGDAHVNNDDPDAYATFERTEPPGAEFYSAGANADGGLVYARASRTDPLPPAAISTSAAASIEETIHFDELPEDSVSVTAILGVGVTASRIVGFASASARLDLGACYVAKGYNAVSGPTSGGNCPGSQGNSIQLVLTREQLIQSGGELDISVSVSAQLESFGGLDATAEASGGASLMSGDARLASLAADPAPGTIYLALDPPLAVSYSGTHTVFPAPEPGAPLLAAACGATLCALRRVRRRG